MVTIPNLEESLKRAKEQTANVIAEKSGMLKRISAEQKQVMDLTETIKKLNERISEASASWQQCRRLTSR